MMTAHHPIEPLAIAAYLPTYAPQTTPAQISRLPRFEARTVMICFQPGDPIAMSSVITNCDEVATHQEHIALLREAARRLNRFAADTEEALRDDEVWEDTAVVLSPLPSTEAMRQSQVDTRESATPFLEPSEPIAVTLTLKTIDSLVASLCEQVYDWADGHTDYDVLHARAVDLATLTDAIQKGCKDRFQALLAERAQSTTLHPTR